MAHRSEGKARTEVGKGEGWEKATGALFGLQERDDMSTSAARGGNFIHPPTQAVWPSHLKEAWDKGLMNTQLIMTCTLEKQL